MPRQFPGDGGSSGGGASGSFGLPQSGITLRGNVQLVAYPGVQITVIPEQNRIELRPGFSDEAQGDIMFRGADTWQRLAAGTAGFKLQTNGPGANPTWVLVS